MFLSHMSQCVAKNRDDDMTDERGHNGQVTCVFLSFLRVDLKAIPGLRTFIAAFEFLPPLLCQNCFLISLCFFLFDSLLDFAVYSVSRRDSK